MTLLLMCLLAYKIRTDEGKRLTKKLKQKTEGVFKLIQNPLGIIYQEGIDLGRNAQFCVFARKLQRAPLTAMHFAFFHKLK